MFYFSDSVFYCRKLVYVKSYRELDFPLRELKANRMKLTSQRLNVYCTQKRLCLHKNKLYCANLNTISIYGLDLQLICMINFNISMYPLSIHPQSDGYLIVAARKGLFRMTSSGQEVEQIFNGSFVDVHANKDMIASIEVSQTKLYLLQRIDLKLIRTISIQQEIFSSLMMVGTNIYLSSHVNNFAIVDTYTTTGTRINRITLQGDNGSKNALTLCAWDSDGLTILVAFFYDLLFQVCDSQLKNGTTVKPSGWQRLNIHPLDIVISPENNYMYVMYISRQTSSITTNIRKYYLQQ